MPSKTPAQRLLLAVVILNLLLVAMAATWLYQSRKRHESLAVQSGQNLARSLALSLAGSLDKLDVGLFAVASEVDRQLAAGGIRDAEVNGCLARQKKQIGDFEDMWVADAQGDIRWGTTLPSATPINITDREYFVRTRSDGNNGMVISKPVMGRVTKAWSILVARRLSHPDGSFAGLAMGSLRAEDYFTSRFSQFEVGPGGRIGLRDDDLALVARFPKTSDASGLPGSRMVSARAREQLAKAPVSGSYRATTPDDGVERLYSYMKLSGYPYRIFVAISVSETFWPWWLEVAAALLLVTGFSTSLALYARGGLRSLRQKEREDKQVLARSEARFRAIVANSHDGIIFADAKGIILYRSPSYRNINGYEDHYRLGQPGFETVHPDDLPGVRELWARMLTQPGEHLHATYRIMHRDGHWRWVDATVQNLLENPEVGAVIVTSRDITEQREATEKQRAMEAQLNHLQRMEGIGRLAGGISHDMNNVLAAIMSVAETLRHLDPDKSPMLDLVLEAARRGRNLVKGLMTFARKEMEKVEPVDLNHIVQEQARILSSTMLQRIKVRLELAEDLPTLTGSPTALVTALMNLCVNAMDAMPEGGTLTLRTRRVEEGMVELMVGDTGHGMPPEVLSRAMEPFFTTKPVGKGTGLGLAMVFGTVQAHGGRLELQSQVGKGTEIHLHLPVARKGARAASVAGPVPEDAAAPCRILLVDDDEQVRRATRMMLEARGHQVTAVAGGQAALELAEAGAGWEVAVLDMNMPDLNGTATLTRLRALRPDLPVILATGYADEELVLSLDAVERVVLLTKPFSFQEFQSAWRSLA